MGKKRPEPKSGILDIAAYEPGKSTAPFVIERVKLSSNENPLGPGGKAREALTEARVSLQEYPDGSVRKLREAIASHYRLDPDNVICGNGSDDLLSMIAGAYLAPGDEAIYTEHGFLYYPVVIRAAGAVPVTARETDYTANVDAILSCVSERTKIVFLANPNNPTGTCLPGKSVRRLRAALPEDVILTLDAAYAEYVQQKDYESGIELVSDSNNVIMTRTFSKIHGLAALRIGWAYAPDHIVDALNRIRGPFNVNALAIAAGAAAIGDSGHVRKSVAHNGQWLPWVREELEKIGLKTTPSVGNFVLVHFPGDKISAREANAFLQSNGYLLRAVKEYGLPDALRMTIGTEEQNRGVVRLLSRFMKGQTLL